MSPDVIGLKISGLSGVVVSNLTGDDMQTLHLIRTGALPEDEEIKAIAKTDKHRAASLVAAKYRDRLFHHASYVLKDPTEATDVVQEVFIKAMRERRFFDEDFKMKAWLFRVTSNLCFNIRRDTKRRAAILETVPRPRFRDATQVRAVAGTQQQQAIFEAMQRVSANHRQILMLRYYDDLSYAEIADTLEIKLGTVMSRLSRAKRALMEALDGLGVQDLHD